MKPSKNKTHWFLQYYQLGLDRDRTSLLHHRFTVMLVKDNNMSEWARVIDSKYGRDKSGRAIPTFLKSRVRSLYAPLFHQQD